MKNRGQLKILLIYFCELAEDTLNTKRKKEKIQQPQNKTEKKRHSPAHYHIIKHQGEAQHWSWVTSILSDYTTRLMTMVLMSCDVGDGIV